MGIDRDAANLGAAWGLVTGIENRILRLSQDYFGKDAPENMAPYLEKTAPAHASVDALREKLKRTFNAPTADRQAFVEEYVAAMPGNLDAVFDASVAAAKVFIDFIPKGNKHRKTAKKILADLNKIQPS